MDRGCRRRVPLRRGRWGGSEPGVTVMHRGHTDVDTRENVAWTRWPRTGQGQSPAAARPSRLPAAGVRVPGRPTGPASGPGSARQFRRGGAGAPSCRPATGPAPPRRQAPRPPRPALYRPERGGGSPDSNALSPRGFGLVHVARRVDALAQELSPQHTKC